MSQQRYTSPRLRYLKARLLILARPGFLIAVAFLSAVGFAVKEYWTNPDFLKFSLNQEFFSQQLPSNSQSTLSDEDRAIAADIGNLSVLDYDKKQADIGLNTSISEKAQTQKTENYTNILDAAKKNQNANEIKSNISSQTVKTSSTLPQNPFLKQAENLLQFKVDSNKQVSNVNNSSSLTSGFQTPQGSFSLGIGSSNYVNQNQNANSESALQAALNQSNSQNQENSAATTANNQNLLSQLSQNSNHSSSTDNRLRPNQANPLVDTRIFNQPLTNQVTTNNYNQLGVNNQLQNPYSNFNNYQQPTANNNQPGVNNQLQNPYGSFNNQLPATSYIQPAPNSSLNNNQLPSTSYVQPNLYNNFNNNQQQNPYSNFNNNQLPGNNYNFNGQVQNPYTNNNQITGNRYSPEIRARVNRIYNRLTNRNNPAVVNPNTYTAPNNINTGFGQPNTQQLNSTYSNQTPTQLPINGYRY